MIEDYPFMLRASKHADPPFFQQLLALRRHFTHDSLLDDSVIDDKGIPWVDGSFRRALK
jgi:hypothetical protein